MTPLRIGVVGAGLIGRRHLDVLLPDPAYAVVGIADVTPAAAAFASEAGIPYFSDADSLIDAAGPDGIVVAVPNRFHEPVGLAAIARGVPVLIEKPLADSLAGALRIADAAERAGVPVLVGHHRRHNPIMRRAAEMVAAGAVGRVTAAVSLWLAHKPASYFEVLWRREPGAGPILINAIHDIDCLRMICGEIDSVQAFAAGNAREMPVEDTAAAALRFASGALGTLIVSDAVSSPYNWEWTSRENPAYPHEAETCFTINGSRGSLTVPSLQLWTQREGEGWFDPLIRERAHVALADPYVVQMRHFAEVIRGTAAPVVSALEGARTLAATLAIAESATCGAAVRVDDLIARARAPHREASAR